MTRLEVILCIALIIFAFIAVSNRPASVEPATVKESLTTEIRSLAEIQAIIGAKPDGIYGPATKEAWEKYLCDQYARKEFE